MGLCARREGQGLGDFDPAPLVGFDTGKSVRRKLLHAAANAEVSAVDMVKLTRVRVDMDQHLAGMIGRQERVAIGRRFAQARADREDEVRAPDPVKQFGIGAVAEIACPDRAVVRYRILTPEGRSNGDAPFFRKGLKSFTRLGIPVCPANDRDRSARVEKQLFERGEARSRRRLPDRFNLWAINGFNHVTEHILGERNNDRAGPTVHRDRIGARDIFGDAPRVINPQNQFGERRKHRAEIDLLKSLPVAHAPVHITNEEDHWLAVLASDMNADTGVGRPRTARDKGDARALGEGAIGAGHERDSSFLTANYSLDLWRVVERIEYGKEAFSRDSENPVAALNAELIDQDAPAGAGGRRWIWHWKVMPQQSSMIYPLHPKPEGLDNNLYMFCNTAFFGDKLIYIPQSVIFLDPIWILS